MADRRGDDDIVENKKSKAELSEEFGKRMDLPAGSLEVDESELPVINDAIGDL